jgi:2-oxo-3-hexenedioate decarboxylase/2-keto-4-pentenoate hydratase
MEEANVWKAAEALTRGRIEHTRMEVLPAGILPRNEVEAYLVQDKLHQLLSNLGSGVVAGHKIGCTTPVMQRFLGIDNPCAGGVFATTVRDESGEFLMRNLLHPGVECEIAVMLGEDLPQKPMGYDRVSVAHAVESIMAAIEVVDDRWNDYKVVDTPTLIADDFFGAGCVLAKPVTDWRFVRLPYVSGSMSINGNPVGSGKGEDIMGHPLAALAWLANNKLACGSQLHAGEFVLLGSIVETKWVSPGDTVTIELEGIGRASAHFS